MELQNLEILERLVLHWDRTLFPSLKFFLGVPASSDSTGKNVAAVDEVGVRDKIIAFCFDTKTSNTGMVQGAYIKLSKNLDEACFGWPAALVSMR